MTLLDANIIQRTRTTLSIEIVSAYGGGVYLHTAVAGEKTDALLTVEEARHLVAQINRILAEQAAERVSEPQTQEA